VRSNFATRDGEIDLIMRQQDTVVFVEVKTRQDETFATGEDAVNYGKQRRMAAAARSFIQKHHLHECPCRFDMVVVVKGDRENVIRHHENVFVPPR
jgi:putative endonuclease